jgi:hypothetical protein
LGYGCFLVADVFKQERQTLMLGLVSLAFGPATQPKSKAQLILEYARDLLEKGWTQQTLARDKAGKEVSLLQGESFCAIGAIARASADLYPDDPTRNKFETDCICTVADAVGLEAHELLPNWNDTFLRKKSDVLTGFDRAINVYEAWRHK